MPREIRAEFPEKLRFLAQPARYKVVYGGRGKGASWGYARQLLIDAYQRPLRILCTREHQISIADSVYALLSDQVVRLGLAAAYDVQRSEIIGRNGSKFIFAGLRHNIANLKSYEGVDRVWVEEANTVSAKSWEVLTPTIRKDGSEIWGSFNPELESDPAYQMFIANEPPTGAQVVQMSWRDNHWFPKVLDQERQDMQRRDPDAYLHVWEGKCRQSLTGAIYAAELRACDASGRIRAVPHIPEFPVHRFWDLGWADNTAIWFAQFVGQAVHLINHQSGSRRKISEYLDEAKTFGYRIGDDWLPHDGEYGSIASHGQSVSGILRTAGCKVRIVPRTKNVVADLEVVRSLFPRMAFDSKNCADGLQDLRRYVWRTDKDGHSIGKEPLHDMHSHSADGLRCCAMAVQSLSVSRKPAGSIRRAVA